MVKERLQKILSRAGVASRRHAEELILAGQVSVNGQIIQTLGSQADAGQDRILVKGRRLVFPKKYHYYAYYKPRGVVVTKKDERGRRGIFDRLKLPKAVNAVGRLDKDSEGLLLLSDDGDFIQHYTHPSFEIPKVYRVQASRRLKREELKRLQTGMVIQNKTLRAVRANNLPGKKEFWLELELREGFKREIRRMLEALQVTVLRLIRIQHGSVKVKKLNPGQLLPLKIRPH